MKFSARFAARRGRTRRSPRMSCSPMIAASAVSNPLSSPSTASATCGLFSASASRHDPTGARLASAWSASTWLMRSRAPSLQSATMTRLPPALADGVIEQVIGRGRAEGLDVAQPEALDGLGGELELGDRHEVERAQLVGRALTLGIEAPDGLQRIAEEIEPHRLGHARCV